MRRTCHPGDDGPGRGGARFEQYDLLSAAVVDENERLVGVLTIDDVVDVIHQEADEDLLRMGGVGDEELSDTVFATSRSRVPWLLINLATAVVSASVIGQFGATIEQMVALAALMPIVASLGGNAGTQTMTVTVRALATAISTSTMQAASSGASCMVGLPEWPADRRRSSVLSPALWFQNVDLGRVIAAAMVINMLAAALGGILIPLLLDRFGADLAISSSIFTTMITDVLGFLAFLSLAHWWMDLG